MDLAARVCSGESGTVEFEKSIADSQRIVEAVAAMAGDGCGTLLVRVRDDGSVGGWFPGEGRVERMVQQVLRGTDPRVYVAVELAELEGKPVLVIRVPAGDGPHFGAHRRGRSDASGGAGHRTAGRGGSGDALDRR